MPPSTRTCPSCATPLPGHTPGCGLCGENVPSGDSDFAADGPAALERVRRVLADRYAIERAVGEGGTATVYLARDPRHRREVAVKVLRPEIARLVGSDRFLREIEIAARLQHPHILPVYDSGEAAGEGEGARLLFYVMPLAAESLASRIERGGMPLGDAVRVLSQVADALAFAHAAGVVHRDIKPDNVMLAGRHAMVADFGIAKALTVPITGSPKTRPGVPVGTPYYMAPEQVAGDPEVDGRADQYALGVVAYELLTGRRPFTGKTVQEVLAAQVLEGAEPVGRLRPDVPPGLAQVVMRALAKVPEERWASTEELAAQLESFALALGSASPPDPAFDRCVPAARSRSWASALRTGALAAGALAAGAVAAAVMLPGRAAPLATPMSEQISFSGAVGVAAVSPDGRLLAWSSRDDGAILIQEIAGGEPHEIARGLTDVLALRWSPDGGRLLVGGRYQGEPGLYVLPRLGGAPRRLGRARLGQWHPAGGRVSMWDYPDRAVRLTDLETGDSSRVPLPGVYDWLSDAEWSPSGMRVAYVTVREPNHYALRVTTPGAAGAGVLVEDTMPIGSPRWVPEEDALYYLSGRAQLWKVKLSGDGLGRRGDPVTLLDGLQAASSEVADMSVPFTVTADRRLVYLKGLDYSNLWLVTGLGGPRGRMVTTRRLTSGTAQRRGVSLSPDGRWIAYLETSNEGTDLYRMSFGGGPATRITHTGRIASSRTAWSPDGSRIAVGVSDGGSVRLATVTVDGGELAVFRESHLPAMGDLAWSPGSRILYQVAGNRNFRAMNPANGAERALVSDPEVGWLFAAVSSPDGERVAAYWNRRQLGGVWVLSVRDTGRALLQAGRADPIGWSAGGRSVLTLGWDSSEVVRVGLDGRTEALGTLPFRDPSCVSAEAMAPGALVCSVPERVSDVWMVEGFDPEVR